MSYLGVGVSPGNVPVSRGTNLRVLDRRVRLAELVLRCLICCLGVLAAVLVGTDTQVKEILSIQKKARFTDMKALVFLVAANVIAATYSLAQGVRCVVGMVKGSALFSRPLAWVIFSGDQIMEKNGIKTFCYNRLTSPHQLVRADDGIPDGVCGGGCCTIGGVCKAWTA
ncbi:hypothetical protein OIU76_021650 [Salix suchowensis]|uniref:CASP-like protein n=1 Tax=Salix koriyanagi TaxID=2511006 RepID=A0A9Q1AQ30_9ROSI|nr:hypothetical protein OIU76_021650 [Salix suchowensis]KAJ6779112.1 NITRATE FORMATE IRON DEHYDROGENASE [Salix koriyanagi]